MEVVAARKEKRRLRVQLADVVARIQSATQLKWLSCILLAKRNASEVLSRYARARRSEAVPAVF